MPDFFAHSGNDHRHKSDFQLLSDHLRGVAEGARIRAETVGALAALPALAEAAGWLYDLGKYRLGFQRYLLGQLSKGNPLTLHKQAGAAKASAMKLPPVAFAVFGHHGGLPDKIDLECGIKPTIEAAKYQAIWTDAATDCPPLQNLASSPPTFRSAFEADLLTRVLFSCLVDADWADTGKHVSKVNGWPGDPPPPPFKPDELLATVLAHISDRAREVGVSAVSKARADILAACLSRADEAPGLFSLTVPTGGGKTLAGLAFALKHTAKYKQLRRVIYVAPYMTILEQNADVFRKALGIGANDPLLFEHYSLAEPPGDLIVKTIPESQAEPQEDDEETQLMSAARRAENWDAPFIVTTNVQFFESLFSNKPGRCRKLHNIARSVIILDECQTLPPGLVAPTCGMIRQLAEQLGCTIVLCTATQPAFDHASLQPDERLVATEIAGNLELFARLKRVKVEWPKQFDTPLDWPDIGKKMRTERAALCVVNTKRAAREVYDALKARGTAGLFHLSTGMCPQHRREKLLAIRARLDAGAPCYVVSTQLIEAGVDVDFPFVMRELAPLEAILQAAGRCNREGKLSVEGGRVLVFVTLAAQQDPKKYYPPDLWYKAGRDKIRQMLAANGDGPQLDNLGAIRDYFERLYRSGDSLDAHQIQTMRKMYKFKSVSQNYRLIDNAGEPVVVATWKSRGEEIAALLADSENHRNRAAFRKLAPFQVNLFAHQRINSAHLMHQEPSGFWVWDGKYDDDVGLVHEQLDEMLIG